MAPRLVVVCANLKHVPQMVSAIQMDLEGTENGVVDIGEWVSRVTLEMVGRGVLDYSFDPLLSPSADAYTAAIGKLRYVLHTRDGLKLNIIQSRIIRRRPSSICISTSFSLRFSLV